MTPIAARTRSTGKAMTMTVSCATARLAVCLVLAATLGGVLTGSAKADEHGRDEWRDHARHGDDRHREDSRREDWRHEDWRHEDWRHESRRDEYRHRPDVYYSAPPVVEAPRGYYAQPGASLNFSLPFFR
jgi:hypothetical protein